MTQIRYVTNGATGTWTGGGVPLTPAQVDENFYHVKSLVDALELAEPVSIDDFRFTTATTFYVDLTDTTSLGPYDLPISYLNPRGGFTGGVNYAVNDVFDDNGSLYYVRVAHTSTGPFDPNAQDGLLNPLYGLLIEPAGTALPTGGATGYVLMKDSSTDFDFSWQPPLPTGGATGYGLVKTSSSDFATTWAAVANAPSVVTGTTGAGTATLGPTAGGIYPIVPTADLTINASSVPVGPVYFIFTTTGATARNVTWGTNFKSSGVVTTGTVAAKVISAHFIGDGTTLTEITVSGAM